jgi:hypothetical protein
MSDENEEIVGSKMKNPNASPAVEKENAKIKEANKVFEEVRDVPPGYVNIKLSTKGKVGAPASFWIRDFIPEDLAVLATTPENDMPIKVVEILDKMIWNPDPNNIISVKNFHEKEVIETLLDIYELFYTTVFADQTWIPTDEDYEFLAEKYGGKKSAAYREQVQALEDGDWKPKFDLDISKLDYYELPEDFKTSVRVKKTVAGEPISIKFSLPKYGDFITLKFFIDEMYKKEDQRWKRIGEIIKFREDAKERLVKGENVNLSSIPNVPDNEYEGYKKYEEEKVIFTMTATKALYIQEFNGVDYSHTPLVEKINVARDPRVTYALFQQAQTMFDKLKFGYKEEITVFDPIMQKVVNRNYTFQLSDLLQAISAPRDIEADISFE